MMVKWLIPLEIISMSPSQNGASTWVIQGTLGPLLIKTVRSVKFFLNHRGSLSSPRKDLPVSAMALSCLVFRCCLSKFCAKICDPALFNNSLEKKVLVITDNY